MKTTVEFLDALKAMHGLASDYQLSKFLGCTRGAISSYRMGKSYLDEEMAMKVAFELSLDDGYVLACVASERARKPEVKKAWAHTAEMLYGLAAVLAVVAFLPFAPDILSGGFDLNAAPALLAGYASKSMYIMSNLDWYIWLPLSVLAALAWHSFPRSRSPD